MKKISTRSGNLKDSKPRKQAGKLAKKTPAQLESDLLKDTQRLVAELQARQIELEAQNEQLRQTQTKFEEIPARYFDHYEMAPVGYVIVNEKGLILEANFTIASLLGVTRSELTRKPLSRFIHKEHADRFHLRSQQLFESGEAQACELQMLKKDRSPFWVHVNITAGQDTRGAPIARVVLTDIHERKLAEEALWFTQEKLSLALTSSNLGWWDWHILADTIYLSPEFGEISGYHENKISPASIFFKNIVHPDDAPRIEEARKKRLQEQRDEPIDIEFRIKRKSGEYIWIHRVGKVIERDEKGASVRITGVISDITWRKQAEEQMQLQLSAMNAAANGIVITNRDNTFEWANPAFSTLTGYTLSEVIGKNPRILKSGMHDQVFYKNMWDTLLSGQVWHGEIINRRKDGSFYTEEQSITPLLNERGEVEHFIAIKQDVTARKQAENTQRESDQFIRLIAENIPGMVGYWTRDLRCKFANKNYLEWFGRTAEQMQDIQMQDLLGPELFQANEPYIRAALRGENQQFERKLTKANGETGYTWAQYIAHVVDGDALGFFAMVLDITERKQAEEKLRKSEMILNLIINTAPQIIFWKDLDGRYLGNNQAFANTTGFEPAQIIGKTDFDLPWPREDLETYQSADREVIEKNGPIHTVAQFKQIDGSRRWIDTKKVPLRDANGQPFALLGIVEDITERKQAEEALSEARKRFESIIEASDVGTWDWNVQTGEALFNERWAEITGYTLEELKPLSIQTWIDLAHPDDLQKSNNLLEKHFRGEIEFYELESRMKHKNGQWVWVLDRGKIMTFDADGKPLRMLGTHTEVTERKQAEDALRESEQRLTLATEAGHIGVWDWDVVNDVLVWEDNIYSLYGIRKEDFSDPNDAWLKTLHPDDYDFVYAEMEAALRDKREYAPEFRIIRADGEVRYMQASSQTTYDESGKALRVIGINMDITERRRAEINLKTSEKQLSDIINTANDGIMSISEEQNITLINPAAEQMFGYEPGSLVGKKLSVLIPEKSRSVHSTHIAQYGASNKTHRAMYGFGNVTGLRANGQVFPIEASISQSQSTEGKIYSVIIRDVTERKKMEGMLHRSEARFKTVFEQASVGVAQIETATGHFTLVNQKYCDIVGYSRAEMEQIDFQTVTHPDDLAYDLAHTEQLKSGKIREFTIEKRYIKKSGDIVWVILTVSAMWAVGETPDNHIAVVQDITARKLAERQVYLQTSALNAAANAIVITNRGGIIEWVNSAFSELTGYTIHEAVGKKPGELIKSEMHDRAFYKNMWDTILTGQAWHGEVINRRKDGNLYTEEQIITPVLNEHGEIEHFIAIKQDITERKQQDKMMQESEEKYRELYAQSPEDIFIVGLDGKILDFNRDVSISGFRREEIVGRHVLEQGVFGDNIESAKTQITRVLASDSVEPFEYSIKSSSGEDIWVDIHPVIINERGNKVLRVMVSNITSRKQQEESMMLAHDQAVKANRLKSQLIAKVSHELRTPLSSVLGFAELLKYNIFGGELNAEQLEATDQIIDSAHYLTDMVNEFLDEAEIESRSLILDYKPFAIADVLKYVKATMSIIANKKDLELKTYLAPDLPETVWGDARHLQQILINLTNNAIKFTRAGEVSINMQRHSENQWEIQVKDTGVGIPKDAQEMIFEPFKQMDNAITRENQGTGLGLTITKQLVELMNGRIFIESEVGKGSTFIVILPIQSAYKP